MRIGHTEPKGNEGGSDRTNQGAGSQERKQQVQFPEAGVHLVGRGSAGCYGPNCDAPKFIC